MAATPVKAFIVQPPRCVRSSVSAVPHAASRRLPGGRKDFARFEGLRAQVILCCRTSRGVSALQSGGYW